MPGHDEVAAGHRHEGEATDRRLLPTSSGAEPRAHQSTIVPDPPAGGQRPHRAYLGSGAGPIGAEQDGQVEMDGSRHLVRYVAGQPVTGHRPEADRGQHGDTSPSGFVVRGQRGTGDRNLVGNVDVVHSGIQACPQHGRSGGAKWAGGQQHEVGVADEPRHLGCRPGDPIQVELLGQATQPLWVTSGQHRTVAPGNRRFRNQCPVRPVAPYRSQGL